MKGKLMEKAFRANIRSITPDRYLWTNPIPERIVHYSKQRDPRGYQVHDLRVGGIYKQALSAEKSAENSTPSGQPTHTHTSTHTPHICAHTHTYILSLTDTTHTHTQTNYIFHIVI